MSVWYDRELQSIVLIPANLLARMQRIARMRKPKEGGGALLGMRRGRHIEVTSITTPAKEDSASRFHFIRRDPRHQLKANWLWKRTSGYTDHVGEWHSHDEGIPLPSPRDSSSWKSLGLKRRGDIMITVICGHRTHRCWLIQGHAVRELKKIEE